MLQGIEHGEEGYRLIGYDPGCSIVSLDEADVRWLMDLALHEADLFFAEECLLPFELGRPEKPVDAALWRASLVALFKCFQRSEARSRPLRASEIYDREGRKVFRYFEGLRNGHVVHDSNDVSSVVAGMVLSADGAPLEVIALSAQRDMISAENYSNLRLLIRRAIEWSQAEHQRESVRLISLYAAEDFTERPRNLTFVTPQAKMVNQPRWS